MFIKSLLTLSLFIHCLIFIYLAEVSRVSGKFKLILYIFKKTELKVQTAVKLPKYFAYLRFCWQLYVNSRLIIDIWTLPFLWQFGRFPNINDASNVQYVNKTTSYWLGYVLYVMVAWWVMVILLLSCWCFLLVLTVSNSTQSRVLWSETLVWFMVLLLNKF